MNTIWTSVALSEIASPISRPVDVIAGERYRTIGVKWWGEGAYERETIDGAATAAKTLSIIRQDDLIINKIWVRHGSTAIADESVDGCAASGEFPAFVLDKNLVLPRWLHWLTKTRGFWAQCDALSRGTSGKNRIKPERFLTVTVPLPPLKEQVMIVRKIEELAGKISEASRLRQETREECIDLLASTERKIWPSVLPYPEARLDAVTTFLARGRQSEQGQSDHYLIKTQHVQMDRYVPSTLTLAPQIAAKVSEDATIQDGDILIACSAAGCLGRVARFHGDGQKASTDTHVAIARANPEVVDPDYLYAYLRGAQGQFQLRSRERGDWKREKISFRLTELNLSDLKAVPVPLPPREEQVRIVAELSELRQKIDQLERLQSESESELDALLPSVLSKAFAGEL
jgi:type I restriction enzyme S subunit